MFNLGLASRNQQGFALAELVIAAAIAALIAGGSAAAVFQVMSGSAHASNHMSVIRQVQSAGYWVSRDGQTAQAVSPAAGAGLPLTLTWTDWDSSQVHQVVYVLQNGEFQRNYFLRDAGGEEIVNDTSVVARFIDPEQTACQFTAEGVLIFTVTAVRGGGTHEESAAMGTFQIVPRQGL